MKALVLALALQSAGPNLSGAGGEPTALSVSVERVEGQALCTVRAQQVSLERFLSELAREAGLDLHGFAAGPRAALVTLELERRPLAQVVEYALGSLGLRAEIRADAISLLPQVRPSVAELGEQALATYRGAVARFPDHDLADDARLALGGIEERRRQPLLALEHYRTLIEQYRASTLVGEALRRSGRIHEARGEWTEASAQFRRLTERREEEELLDVARVELARCSLELGDPSKAMFLIDALDSESPPASHERLAARTLVRARALNALQRHADALERLGLLRVDRLEPEQRPEWIEGLAVALEGAGHLDEAGRAWLMYSAELEGAARMIALENAARLALAGGDELGALFACERAGDATSPTLGALERSARARLDLYEETGPESNVEQRLGRARSWLEQGRAAEAAALLGTLWGQSAPADEELRTEIALMRGQALERSRGMETALVELRDRRSQLAGAESRRLLDLEAAAILERNGLWDRAVLAYGGSY